MPSCKEVTHLVLTAQDRKLKPLERQMLRIHWRVCEGCRHFVRHLRLHRAALDLWRQERDGS